MCAKKFWVWGFVFVMAYGLTVISVAAFQSDNTNRNAAQHNKRIETTVSKPCVAIVAMPENLTRKQAAAAALGLALGVRYAQMPQNNEMEVKKISYGCAK